METICMKCQMRLSEKNIANLSSAEFAQRKVNVKLIANKKKNIDLEVNLTLICSSEVLHSFCGVSIIVSC